MARPQAVIACWAAVAAAAVVEDLRDPRLALYLPKHLRDAAQYRSAVQRILRSVQEVGLIPKQPLPQLRRRMLRRRSAAVLEQAPCAVSVHYGRECLEEALKAAEESRIWVDSVLSAENGERIENVQVYRPGSAALAKLLLREGGVRFVVAWPSCSLESLEPPAVVLVHCARGWNHLCTEPWTVDSISWLPGGDFLCGLGTHLVGLQRPLSCPVRRGSLPRARGARARRHGWRGGGAPAAAAERLAAAGSRGVL
ncbi:unnamed protein product [Durusdinium trenchii]|uniref:Uncharacterized protein n=1 Tax=Durusdinium trenchii TaxID=1381693 RepID=A0ABP0LJY8_9DINO